MYSFILENFRTNRLLLKHFCTKSVSLHVASKIVHSWKIFIKEIFITFWNICHTQTSGMTGDTWLWWRKVPLERSDRSTMSGVRLWERGDSTCVSWVLVHFIEVIPLAYTIKIHTYYFVSWWRMWKIYVYTLYTYTLYTMGDSYIIHFSGKSTNYIGNVKIWN